MPLSSYPLPLKWDTGTLIGSTDFDSNKLLLSKDFLYVKQITHILPSAFIQVHVHLNASLYYKFLDNLKFLDACDEYSWVSVFLSNKIYNGISDR